MRGLVASLVLLLGLHAGPPGARAEASALAGRWTGETAAGRVELQLAPSGRGFAVRLAVGARTLFDSTFAPSDRPGVLEATATGLFAMLGTRRAPANPLEGEELVWAREATDQLVLSRLAIADGKPAIERARLLRAGERLRLVVERLAGERMAGELEADLVRAGR